MVKAFAQEMGAHKSQLRFDLGWFKPANTKTKWDNTLTQSLSVKGQSARNMSNSRVVTALATERIIQCSGQHVETTPTKKGSPNCVWWDTCCIICALKVPNELGLADKPLLSSWILVDLGRTSTLTDSA